MSSPDPHLPHLLAAMAMQARAASRRLAVLDPATKSAILHAMADALPAATEEILAANQLDIADAEAAGRSAALIDRLRLDPARIEAIARGLREVAAQNDPVGEEIESFTGAQDIRIRKVRVPIGVIAMIYESRPNVTLDAAAICIKSGNAVLLRGGSESLRSNTALATAAATAAETAGLPAGAMQLVPVADRAAVPALCHLEQFIDVIIPRGGHSLIEAVVSEARMPVIKHYDGICHIYLDAAADPAMAEAVTINAKCQRPGVCNAAETLLVHQDAASALLPRVAAALHARGVQLRCDAGSAAAIGPAAPTVRATEDDWRTEHLDLILGIRVVDSLDQAIHHINHFGSHHSDAIITADETAARRFLAEIDSAAVYWNASTRFTDGGQFGFGAEIGISTDKLHARGPVGVNELTSYKYLVTGTGQCRN